MPPHLSNPYKYNRMTPGKSTVRTIAEQIKQILFGNGRWQMNYDSMLYLLDLISKDPRSPNPYKMP